MNETAKKVVVITGASRGIGKAIALEFADGYHHLILNTGHDEKSLLSLKEELDQKLAGTNCQVALSVGDVANPDYVQTWLDETQKEFGTIDLLVNNAGIASIGLITDLSNEDWSRIINTNLSSAFYTSKAVLPGMIHEKKGRIVNISSVWGNVGASCEVAYSATKGGLNSFTKALAKEVAPSNIQVNAIACGTIDTKMNQCFSEEERSALAAEIPAGRFGLPEEVAKMVLQLATAPDYLTGQIITLDGGWV